MLEFRTGLAGAIPPNAHRRSTEGAPLVAGLRLVHDAPPIDIAEPRLAGDVADLPARLNEVAAMPDAARAGISRKARDYCRRFDRATILANLLAPASLRTAA